MGKKERIDILLVKRKIVPTREKARGVILSGVVFVNGKRVDKQGSLVDENSSVVVRGNPLPYVSRGGLKLEKALREFSIVPENFVCLDIGASTGGFTDCLLKNGAKRVFSVDTGKGKLDFSLIKDSRVTYYENYNARYLKVKDFPEEVFFDLVAIDVSFISQKLILLPLSKFLLEKGRSVVKIISLIKPQFEAGKRYVKKGGIVKDESVVLDVEREIVDFAEKIGFKFQGSTYYNRELKRKNTEILAYFTFKGKNV